MSRKLGYREFCPLHKSYFCCGRQRKRERKSFFRQPIRTLPDGRVICSQAELRHRKAKLLAENPYCAACDELFTDFREVELGHRFPKGMGGFKHHDAWENLVLLHRLANREMGSRTLEQYLNDPKRTACDQYVTKYRKLAAENWGDVA